MRFLLASLAATLVATLPLVAEERPVVVELFTAQGCPACPPADAFLIELDALDDVLPLALHVDYWDYIGWADDYARPAYTARQRGYADAADRRMVYTPQIILNGQDHVVGNRTKDVRALIAQHKAAPRDGVALRLERTGERLRIRADSRAPQAAALQVHLIRYMPQSRVEITRGENAGKTLTYSNIVTEWRTLEPWHTQAPLDLELAVTGDDPVVVVVQQPGFGPIEAAARLR